ncbi:hypothetical protein PORY_002350 [Pneumocystis oryctolagi]|uniref:Uncharacterized protein n=1 Tax=Pneumocystis oryctolagi TaxID=42067 RepID=A0ACB7CBH0_9ASCO|nr:hypothetical protein PORY_002350 [Pneumocystis oryctolagi]
MLNETDIEQTEKAYLDISLQEKVLESSSELEEPCSLQYHFDNSFMCYMLKNQFISYYRYGKRPDCLSKWKDFVWCIRTKNKPFDEQQKMLREKRLERLSILKKGRNSEEIWSLRTQPLESLFDSKNTTL